ncbi:MAG: radical SAM protein [Chloroflexota bacterium]|nr:radical SAM protein [Chloroflexota bacterium]
MKVQEIEAKSLLVKSKIPGVDYVVNPYTGCEFGCSYCYATFMGRFVDESIDSWGNYVYVKTNAVEVLERDLNRLSPEQRRGSILLSSVTDPYQGIESKYRLTRGVLTVLARQPYPGRISILTKSPMVLRDSDILCQLPHLSVGMTVTTTDDTLGRFLEVRAPLARRRLTTLKQLHEQGIHTYAFVGPLLPHFRYQPERLDELFAALTDAGVQSIYVEHINLKPYIKNRLWQTLAYEPETFQAVYRGAETAVHRKILDEIVAELVEKYQLTLRTGEVIYHNKSDEMTQGAG